MGIKTSLLAAALTLGSAASAASVAKAKSNPFDYINPLIGTVNGGKHGPADPAWKLWTD